MKTATTRKPSPLRVVPTKEMDRPPRPLPFLVSADDLLSEDQLVVIRRLQKVMTATPAEVVSTLAGAALWMFGLDPIGREDYERIGEQVFCSSEIGKKADEGLINEIINEPRQAGELWTLLQRRAELEARRAS